MTGIDVRAETSPDTVPQPGTVDMDVGRRP
jgi:hypothetical protein